MRRRPRPQRLKDTWYVSFEIRERQSDRPRPPRATETFRNEKDAKEFAKARLADGSDVNAGTLNPHVPKSTIAATQLLDWIEEDD
jgi:hypothetical protein